jgi:hypothetical protein
MIRPVRLTVADSRGRTVAEIGQILVDAIA